MMRPDRESGIPCAFSAFPSPCRSCAPSSRALVDGRLIEGFEARAPIRSGWRRRRSICRPGAPDGMAREVFLDELDRPTPRCCRASSRSATSTKTNWRSRKRPSRWRRGARWNFRRSCGDLERRLTLARLVAAWAKSPVLGAAGGRRPGLDAGAGRRSGAADGRHGHPRRRLGGARRAGAGPARQILAALARIPADRARRPGRLTSRKSSKIEPAARRDLLIEAEAARLTAHHDGPVIAAGSTGSMPATAKFLHAVAALPQGAVVLPGLDTDLDDEAWQLIGGVSNAQGKFTTPPCVEPSAIRDACAAAAPRHQARRCRNPRQPAGAWTRRAGLRGDAAVQRHRAMASAAGGAGDRPGRFRAA